MLVAIALVAALGQPGLGAAPSATQPLATPTVAPSTSTPADDKMVCRSLQQTGSLFAGPKECHTKREWAAINAQARDDVGAYQLRSNQNSGH